MNVSLGVFCLAAEPGWVKNVFTREEFLLNQALILLVTVLLILGCGAVVIWLANRLGRVRERFFPLHSCDQQVLESISKVLENLSRESKQYDFIALRVRSGTWHGKERTFVCGMLGAATPGEGGAEWRTSECVFLLVPRSEEDRLATQGGRFPFIFCGKDECILCLKESKIRDVTFSQGENP